jgi:hypothetical protein
VRHFQCHLSSLSAVRTIFCFVLFVCVCVCMCVCVCVCVLYFRGAVRAVRFAKRFGELVIFTASDCDGIKVWMQRSDGFDNVLEIEEPCRYGTVGCG